MKILFVTRPIVPPWNEGSKNLTLHLASRLTKHRPHLLTTRALKNCPYRQIQWHHPYSKEAFTFSQKFRLIIFLFLSPPTVDLFHFYFVPTLFTSRILSFAIHCHHKFSVQTVPSLPANITSPDKAKNLLFGDKIVVYSDYTQRRLMDLGITNVTQIDAGIDVTRFSQAKADKCLRIRLGLREEDVLILFAGEYARLGSVNILKRIMPPLVTRNPRCHFLIACRILLPADRFVEANLKRTAKAAGIADHVHFLGELRDFPALLRSCDIFLFPVADMNGKIDTPLTILEAMAAGLPIITHDITPLNEIFGRDSFATVTHDHILIQRILLLAADPNLRFQEGYRLQKLVNNRYNLANMVKSYEALYDSIN